MYSYCSVSISFLYFCVYVQIVLNMCIESKNVSWNLYTLLFTLFISVSKWKHLILSEICLMKLKMHHSPSKKKKLDSLFYRDPVLHTWKGKAGIRKHSNEELRVFHALQYLSGLTKAVQWSFKGCPEVKKNLLYNEFIALTGCPAT